MYACERKVKTLKFLQNIPKLCHFLKDKILIAFSIHHCELKSCFHLCFVLFSQDIIITLHKTYVNFSNVLTGLRKMPYAENKKQLI